MEKQHEDYNTILGRVLAPRMRPKTAELEPTEIATIEVDGKRYLITEARNAIRFALAYRLTHPLEKSWSPSEVPEDL